MSLLQNLRQRNAILYYLGVVNLAAALVLLPFLWLDEQPLLGINRWVKPFKFFVSIGIYAFTLAWLTGDLENQRYVRRFSWLVCLCMAVEMVIITLQAFRGQKSHYHQESLEGMILYNVMGGFIVFNTILVGTLAYRFWKNRFPQLPAAYLWGIRLGLLLFLLASLEGLYMAQQPGHTVGGPDGGAGLPLLNWSTRFGDLRVAHFVGLHGLQILPLLGAALSRGKVPFRVGWVVVTFVFLLLLTLGTYVQAIQKVPLWATY
ncbi:hypothetical protein GCM10027275_40640 [Rhabdobacter roseus]|uniref:Uncharacterized protein n=1 Tax=Rhabdobacter roseus TaxID=1655419 RepID=A0A840U0Y4_9BACT|nr:hypothetical protein [Rhabdobacter roseus]MBB5286038.1 hypothetical protein [Rhabdobacter roseus]